MLEGILVDLVPFTAEFQALEQKWTNSEANFWGSAGDRALITRGQLQRRREWRAEHGGRGGGWVAFGIRAKDGTPIGNISAGFISPWHRTAMLGALIGEPAYWGGGYGTDALLLIVDYAFDWLNLRKVWLGTMALNARVLRQMEKVGFVQEARRRDLFLADGQWTDEVVFGMLREDWPGRAALIERLGLQARPEPGAVEGD